MYKSYEVVIHGTFTINLIADGEEDAEVKAMDELDKTAFHCNIYGIDINKEDEEW